MKSKMTLLITIILVVLSLSMFIEGNDSEKLCTESRLSPYRDILPAADITWGDVSVKNPAYKKGQGPKVLFDEAHQNFHTSTGGYKIFTSIVTNDGYVVIPNKSEFTADVLEGYDILVISNALNERNVDRKTWKKPPYFPAFTEKEVNAVHDWVRGGGALLLIADHQPFGTAAFDMAKKFEVILSQGKALDPEGTVVFSREKGTILDHPITRGRNKCEQVNVARTFTGESLQVPKGSGFLKFTEKAVDVDPESKKERPIPGHFQGAAFAYGKGRLVILGEAAFMSAQRLAVRTADGTVFFPKRKIVNRHKNDNKQLLLNIMHYLSRLLEPGVSVQGG